jgi:hypothetical protein
MIRRNKTIAAREYFQNFGLGHGTGIYFSYHTLAEDSEEFGLFQP